MTLQTILTQGREWRQSPKANELREYIDKVFKVKKPTMGGLDRELIIDFIAKEVEHGQADILAGVRKEIEKLFKERLPEEITEEQKEEFHCEFAILYWGKHMRDDLLAALSMGDKKE